MRPLIECKRPHIIAVPSIVAAEFNWEIAKQDELRAKIKANINHENAKQKLKFEKLKKKYDREGVEFLQDEMEITEQQQK